MHLMLFLSDFGSALCAVPLLLLCTRSLRFLLEALASLCSLIIYESRFARCVKVPFRSLLGSLVSLAILWGSFR
jgi:hypothetical protein